MTMQEFEKWCNDYGIFHFQNTEFSFHLKEASEIDAAFIPEQLAEMLEDGNIKQYYYTEYSKEWTILVV